MGTPAKKKVVANRKQTNKTAAAPARKFVDYTVHAHYGDGSTRPIGTVEDFSDVDALKSQAIHSALNAGHGVPKFRVVERDYDENRDKEDHMIESEVS